MINLLDIFISQILGQNFAILGFFCKAVRLSHRTSRRLLLEQTTVKLRKHHHAHRANSGFRTGESVLFFAKLGCNDVRLICG